MRIDIPKYHWSRSRKMYILDEAYVYTSPRYGKKVILSKGMLSDGATGAMDIVSLAWWVHDKLCNTMRWADGTPCSRWQGSNVISDILKSEGRWARAWYWKYATFLGTYF